MRHGEARASDGAENLEFDVGVPSVVLDVEERAARRRAGIVDEYVDPAILLDDRVDEPLDVFHLAHVGRHAVSIAARARDLRDGFFDVVRVARADGDFRAFAREFERTRFADAFGAAGHDGDFAFQSQFHFHSPSRLTAGWYSLIRAGCAVLIIDGS